MANTKFSTSAGQFDLMPAEVLEVIYDDSNPNLLYGVKVKMVDDTPSTNPNGTGSITAVPLNMNMLRIPLVGEVVLLIKSVNSYTTFNRGTTSVYYLDIVGLQTSINHNSLPKITQAAVQKPVANGDSDQYQQSESGNEKITVTVETDKNFTENRFIKPLQHYAGDVIFNGRFGQSIRFSATQKSNPYKIAPNWSGAGNGAPITVIKNSVQGTDTKKINDFEQENFTNTDNLIVLASGQSLQFEQSSNAVTAANQNKIDSWKSEKWGTTPQTLISSGRLVFNSSQKEIIAFAKNGIGLSSATSIAIDAVDNVTINSNKIELGSNANEPLILGNLWKAWMNNLINALGTVTVVTPIGPSSPLTASPQWAAIATLASQISTLLSELSYTTKLPITEAGGGTNVKSVSQPAEPAPLTFEQIVEKRQELAAQPDPANTNLTEADRLALADYQTLLTGTIDSGEDPYNPIEEDVQYDPNDILVNIDQYSTYIPETGEAEGPVQEDAYLSTVTTNTPGSSVTMSDKPSKSTKAGALANQLKIKNWLRDKGYSQLQVAGIMGNMHKETGGTFNPLIVNATDTNGYPSVGLIQWNGRYTPTGGSKDKDVILNTIGRTVEQQLDYLVNNTTTFNRWKTELSAYPNPDADVSGFLFAKIVEVCADCLTREAYDQKGTYSPSDRSKFATDYYNRFNDPNDPFKWDESVVSRNNYGEITQAAKGAVRRAIEISLRDKGIRENIVNGNANTDTDSGGRIDQMLRNVGCTPGMPWCASAVTTWWREAGLKTPKNSEGAAGCPQWVAWARRNNLWSSTPVVGAAVLFDWKNGKGYGHIGMVIQINNDGTLDIIEGNTSTPTVKGAVGCWTHRRPVNWQFIAGFVIPSEA